jgi:hypothetical protein
MLAAGMLLLPAPAAAHQCPEWVNPHGETIPPAGFTTAPGTNPNSGVNPDGFFRLVGAANLFDGCFESNSALPGFGGAGTGFRFDANPATPCNQETGVGCEPFASGTTFKFTEANGKDPAQSPMAGSKTGNPSSNAVEWHFWGQGDLLICDVGVTPSAAACTCCRVSPPPR